MSSKTQPIPAPVVETAAGKVEGQTLSLNNRPSVSVFKGIPYGASTAGAGRFMPPRKAEPWTGVREALEAGPRSPHPPFNPPPGPLSEMGTDTATVGEACLCLNVWSPGLDSRKRPVMVWLHGGAFSFGSGGQPVYAGTELASKRDVVAVTVNHRLNLFGYLYLAHLSEKYADSGNAGMLDIVEALEWVRDNIAQFGGDPGNVTIFGESGGGMKVTALMAMPVAKGLFHRAIVQSGAFLQGMPPARGAEITAAVLAYLGLKPNHVDELQRVPMERLQDAISAIPGGPLAIAPVMDGRSLPRHPFDPDAPAISADVPLLIGSNATETTLLGPPVTDLDDATLHAQTKARMKIDDAAARRLLAVYKEAHRDNVEAWLALESDRFMRINSIRQAERKAGQGASPVYMYYFAWRTPVMGGYLRSAHALEIPFVFDHVDVWSGFTGTSQDRYALADGMSAAWVEFARSGKPSAPGLPEWPAYTAAHRATMILDSESSVVNDPAREQRLAFEASGGGSVSLF